MLRPQKWVCPRSPAGNYCFQLLKLANRERLMELCESYGWEPDSEDVDVAPIEEWSEDDYRELWALLASAVSPEEQRYWKAECAPTKLP